MKYLVEIILENGFTPIYNYYNTLEKAMKDIKKMKGVVDVNVYELNYKKSEHVLKGAGELNGNL